MKIPIQLFFLAAVPVLLAFVACEQPVASQSTETTMQSLSESDKQDTVNPDKKVKRPGKNPGPADSSYTLFFLPPLTEVPESEGDFEASLDPVVRIANEQGETIVEFSAEGTGSERVRVGEDHYIVNFHLRRYSVAPGTRLNIEVLLEGEVIGSLAAQVIANGAEKKSVDTQEYVPLVAARTVPIKFRIELTEHDRFLVPPLVDAIDPEPEPINWESDIKVYTYQLEPAGSADDTLYYRTREEDLPVWIVLDEATGVVTVDIGEVELDFGDSVTKQLSFYSSYNVSKADDADGGSTWDEPLVRTFEIYRRVI